MYPIRERCFRLGEDSEITEIRKRRFTPFGDRFTIDVPGPDDLELTGDLLDPEFSIRRGGQTVATVSKRWFRG